MPSIDGWQDGCMDGRVTWWKKLHEKRPWRPLLYVIPLWNKGIFATLKALGRGLQMFFHLQKQRNNLSEFDFLWILKCLLTGLSTKVHMKIKLKASITDPSPTQTPHLNVVCIYLWNFSSSVRLPLACTNLLKASSLVHKRHTILRNILSLYNKLSGK